MTLAAQDTNIALELSTCQYNIPFLNVHFIYHYDLALLCYACLPVTVHVVQLG